MNSNYMSVLSSDLLSQQIVANQMTYELQKSESLLKTRENELNELQSKSDKLELLHKSESVTASAESSPTQTATEMPEVVNSGDVGL